MIPETNTHDVMQVCRNGHVITDRLRTYPERGLSHCDRCGAPTLACCPTCGAEVPGAVPVPGLVPVGQPRPPAYCAACGAAFPWTAQGPCQPMPDRLALLEHLLRRLPLTIRQLRNRPGERPPFRVEDEHDLEDLLRAVLPLHFDDVRPESRTPSYACRTRMDIYLPDERIAVTAKYATPGTSAEGLGQQLEEDLDYYARQGGCAALVGMIYDPGTLLRDPGGLEAAWSRQGEALLVRCVIAS